MATKQYEVQVYYSLYATHYVTAEMEDEAVEKARKLPVREGEVMNNFEAWEEADNWREIRFKCH
jgi:hypothetical protein